jgi:hypothetical protein
MAVKAAVSKEPGHDGWSGGRSEARAGVGPGRDQSCAGCAGVAVTGGDQQLTGLQARTVLHRVDHHPRCWRWVAGHALLSADLDDD